MSDASFGPARRAWLSRGGTDDRNYDEFPTLDSVAERLRQAPDSILGFEMPQARPDAAPGAYPSFEESLPYAESVLARLKSTAFDFVGDQTFAYRILGHGAPAATGVVCSASTSLIARAEEPRIVRNEDVFRSKVAERVALIERSRHLASCVQLIVDGQRAHDLRAAVLASPPGDVVATGTDQDGRLHTVWPLPADAARAVHDTLNRSTAVVADGNHRSLAAQVAGLDRFLVAVFAAEDMEILPYDRAIRCGRTASGLAAALAERGASTGADATGPLRFTLVSAGESVDVAFPAPGQDEVALVHRVVETELLNGVLGMDAADERIAYVAGNDADAEVRALVDGGGYDVAVLIPAVPVSQFVEVNARGVTMPRKSTWFVPKVRAGFVLSEC